MSTSQKLDGLSNICQLAKTNRYRLIFQYQGQKFPGTDISKTQLFSNIIIGSISDEQSKYLDSVCSLPNRDSRTPQEYARELVISWLLEDATEMLFLQGGVKIIKNGSDKNREFLNDGNITSDADNKIRFNNQTRNMEVIYDHTGFWKREGKIDLRHNKHNHLKQMEALLFCLSTQDMQATVFDYSSVVNAEQEMHKIYQKPVMSIKDIGGIFKPVKSVIKEISLGEIKSIKC